MPARLRRVGHVALVTADFDRLAAFYADVFGAEPAYERSPADRRGSLGFLRAGDVVLHVFERSEEPLGGVEPGQALVPFGRGRIDHLSFEAAGVEAFAAAREALAERGASNGTVVDFGPLVSLFFVDPDGTQLELTVTKTEGWDLPFDTTPFRPGGG